jgi:hypothetical protein
MLSFDKGKSPVLQRKRNKHTQQDSFQNIGTVLQRQPYGPTLVCRLLEPQAVRRAPILMMRISTPVSSTELPTHLLTLSALTKTPMVDLKMKMRVKKLQENPW